jgi:putative holliday junction resolvase
VAISDELLLTSTPLGVISRRGQVRDAEAVLALCREHEVAEIVVGQPLELDGRLAHRAERVQAFVDVLAKGFSGPIHAWDERLSTCAAERVLLEADLSRRKRKQNVDKLAASIILQGFLDWRRHEEDHRA